MVLLLASIAGAADASDFKSFGVFTSNQAGNLVLVWVLASEGSDRAWLSAFSLMGCLVGVVIVELLRRTIPWLRSPVGARLLLLLAAGVLVATAVVSAMALGSDSLAESQNLTFGSQRWWAAAIAVTSSAIALAMLGTVFVVVGAWRAAILAPPVQDSFRLVTVAMGTRDARYRARLRGVVGFPIAWALGAATAAFLPVHRGVISLGGAMLIVLMVVLSRRVGGVRVTDGT